MALNIDIKGFLQKCVRVWHIMKKPDKAELIMVTKASAIGILIIGFIGFVISVILTFIK